MEELWKYPKKRGTYLWHWIRNIALALWLSLWISNFSYSQENAWWIWNRIENSNESIEKDIEAYKTKTVHRNNDIINNTNETLDEFVARLQRYFEFEVNENKDVQQKIDEIKNLLNKKYSQNITNNDPFFIIQAALKAISKNKQYEWLSLYSNKFSWNFDLNFVDALWYVQYKNDLKCNGIISNENWKMTLNKIIESLNDWWNEKITDNETLNKQKHKQNGSNSSETSNIDIWKKMEYQTSTNIGNGDKIVSDYTNKIENRNKNIIDNTNESLNDFANRINNQFKNELEDENSLITKKISSIKELLNNKYNYHLYDNSIIVVESALKELSKTEKYKWLKDYADKFSWNFDINFINAYWLVQYINDWDCSWSIGWKNWAFILQTIYDELNVFNNNSKSIDDSKNDLNDNHKNNTNEQILNDNDHNDNVIHDDKENLVENNSIEPNEERIKVNDPTNIEMEWITLLSNNLSYDKLNWITYEDVWNTINWFKHEWLKNAVIERLLHNDVIWAQRLLWMKLNCNKRLYPDYVANTRIWQRELDLMKKLWESRRYMDTQEILNFMDRLEKAYEIENYEVKTIYLKFLSWEIDNDWLPYCIISKYDYKIYLFTSDHKLVACQPVLTGAHIWNKKNNPMGWSHTTPGWMYIIWWFFDRSSEWKNLISTYWTEYILFLPQEWQYVYSKEYSMWMHWFVKWREWRFSSPNTIDHRVSNWCINIDRQTFWEIINHLKKWSRIYICRDDEM